MEPAKCRFFSLSNHILSCSVMNKKICLNQTTIHNVLLRFTWPECIVLMFNFHSCRTLILNYFYKFMRQHRYSCTFCRDMIRIFDKCFIHCFHGDSKILRGMGTLQQTNNTSIPWIHMQYKISDQILYAYRILIIQRCLWITSGRVLNWELH